MPAARYEQVIAALQARVTGLATTGANVFRGLDNDLQESQLPALEVEQGADELAVEYMNGQADWSLDVDVVAIAQATSETLGTALNAIRKEIVVAILADHTLGLGFVSRCREMRASEIERSGAGHKPTGRLRMRWSITYRRSITDPSA